MKCLFKLVFTLPVILIAGVLTLPWTLYILPIAVLNSSGCFNITVPAPPIETIMGWWEQL